MKSRTLYIGIASLPAMRNRTVAVAAGKRKVGPTEPRLWFTSVEAMSGIFSETNQRLLEHIRQHQPDSLAALAQTTGMQTSNLSRSLKRLVDFGLVQAVTHGRNKSYRVTYDKVSILLRLDQPAAARKTVVRPSHHTQAA